MPDEPLPPRATLPSERVDVSDEPIHWDLGTSLSYGEYLQLDRLLDAQRPLTGEHDEMMFILVHQAAELWMRLFLHELNGVLACVRRDTLGDKPVYGVERDPARAKQSDDQARSHAGSPD